MEYGEGKLLQNLGDENFSSDFEDFYNYPICSQEFYTEQILSECSFPSDIEDITRTLNY